MTLAFACIFTTLALLLAAIAFSTDYWTDTRVDRDELKLLIANADANGIPSGYNITVDTDPVYFSRHRGFFRTCYRGSDIGCKFQLITYIEILEIT